MCLLSSLLTHTHTHTQYKKFKEESMAHYEPPGDDILCLCKKEIALSSAVKVKVQDAATAEAEPTVSGGK